MHKIKLLDSKTQNAAYSSLANGHCGCCVHAADTNMHFHKLWLFCHSKYTSLNAPHAPIQSKDHITVQWLNEIVVMFLFCFVFGFIKFESVSRTLCQLIDRSIKFICKLPIRQIGYIWKWYCACRFIGTHNASKYPFIWWNRWRLDKNKNWHRTPKVYLNDDLIW